MGVVTEDEAQWYGVRCVFAVGRSPDAVGRTYEERVTVWRARTAAEAVERAEAEAHEYVAAIDEPRGAYLGLAQSFRMAEPSGDGAEVFSLMRTSDLAPGDYLDRFFDTGDERQRPLEG